MNKSLKNSRAIISIVEKLDKKCKHTILLGRKRNGYGAGRIMPIVGYFKPDEENKPIDVAHRVTFEKTGLEISQSILVARIVAYVRVLQETTLLDVVLSTFFTNNLSPNDEYESLEFQRLTKLSNECMLPGYKQCFANVLFKGNLTYTEIECGQDHNDLIHCSVKTVSSFEN